MRAPIFVAAVTSAAVLLSGSGSGRAAEMTVVLEVKNADCVLCPPIIRRSLMRVHGVKDVKISQANQMADFMATITFDDAVANVPMFIAATINAGFPAHVADAN